MLELKFVRSNLEEIKAMIQNRGYDLDISDFERLDQERRERLSVLEALRHRRNKVSDDIAAMKKNGEDASAVISEMKAVSTRIKEQEKELPRFVEKLEQLVQLIPNIPDESVPVGKDEKDNPVVRTWGEIKDFDFQPLPHWEIGENLGILDFARAAKLSGARFRPVSGRRGCPGARLNQLHDPYSHHGARIYRDPAPLYGECRLHVRDRSTAQI